MKKTMKLEIANENYEHDGFFYADIALPAKDYEIKDAYHRARIPHQNGYREITVNECPILPELEHMRLDTPTMEELNFLAKRLAALSEDERIVLQAVKRKVFDGEDGQLIGIKDVINLTYGLNNVPIIFAVGTDAELGGFVIENELNETVSALDYDSRDLLDKTKIGKMFRESEGGVFVGKKYVVAGDYELPQIYDGKSLPESEPPTDWVFRLKIAKQSIGDSSETEESAEWLTLPVKKSVADRTAEKFDAERIEDCVYFGFESTIPQIESECFGDMQDFDKLNALAQEIQQMSDLDQMHFKAALTAQEPRLLDEIADIAKNLRSYQYAPYLENSSEYFVSYISRFLKKPFDISWLQSQNFINEGEELCERLGVTKTPYGYVAGHWQSLYEYVARHKSGIDPNEKFEVIELCDQTALFTNGRIRYEDLPKGLYKYDLREGETLNFSAIEPYVLVNHGGTVLMKQPLQFGEEGGIAFTEETSPNFSGEEMTLRAFMETEFAQEDEQEIGEIKQ